MLAALESVLAVLLMIGLGFALARRGWFEGDRSSLVSRLVVTVALPAYMIANLMGGYDRAGLVAMLPGLPVPFASMIAGYVIARLLARVLKVRPGRRGTFASMFALSNAIFIGLPVNHMLFGQESLPHVLIFYIANTTLFWTIGVSGIARDGARLKGGPRPALVSAEGLKRILSPPLVAYLLAVALILADLRLPKVLLGVASTLGAMTTPLAMIFIGIVISRVEWRKLRLDRDLVAVMLGRFLVSPILIYLVMARLELPTLMKEVFFVQAAMPAMTQTPIVAAANGADAEYAAIGTSLTTVLGLASIPLCMVAVPILF